MTGCALGNHPRTPVIRATFWHDATLYPSIVLPEKGIIVKVWIDQDLCTGDGLCEEIAPAVFTLLDDGLAYVKEGDDVKSQPGGAAGLAVVPVDLEDAVTEAAEECPGECIFIG
jgi:ferredoxin